jgi:multidrug efflux pump subunit AcrA (membrane-fusion protein)
MAHHLTPNDVVPRLRNDLNVTSPPTGTGAEVIRVGPAGSGDRVILHGFEFSIALMLDGKRTAQDVVTNCARLGLPLNIDTLENFLRQLKAYGLLEAGDPETPARIRPEWNAVVRKLFQSALADARKGDVAEAREDLGQLLALAPATPEALRLLSWLEQHGTSRVNEKTFQQLLRDVQTSWGEAYRPALAVRAKAVVIRRKWPLVAAVAIGAGVFCLSLIPLPRTMAASAELTPLSHVPVLSPRSGVVEGIAVHEGDRVEKGDLLFTWNTEELESQLSDARDAVETAKAPARIALGKTPSGAEAWVRYQKALSALTMSRSALQDATDDIVNGEPPDDQSANEQRVTDAEEELSEARQSLDDLIPDDSADAQRVRNLEAAVQVLDEQSQDKRVLAEAAGTVSHLFLKENQTVQAGETIAQIDDLTRMKMIVVVTPQEAKSVRVGEAMTVRFHGQKLDTTIEAVSDYELAGEVANPNGTLKIESTPVELYLTPKSIMRRLRGA